MIKRLERSLKILLINIWPTYDQIDLRPVKSERKSVVSRNQVYLYNKLGMTKAYLVSLTNIHYVHCHNFKC
jgi:hypothetical protein